MIDKENKIEDLQELELQEEIARVQAELDAAEATDAGEDLRESKEVHSETMDSPQDDKELLRSAEELEAIEMGWNPDHKGDNFVSAREFIRVGQIIKSKQEATKEIKRLNEKTELLEAGIKQLLEDNKKIADKEYKKALTDIESRKLRAKEEGDIQAFEAAINEKAQLEAPRAAVVTPQVPAATNYTQEQLDFAKRNKDWFNQENQDLVDTAAATYDFLKLQDQKSNTIRSEADLLKEVEQTIKVIPRFADRFPKTAAQKAKESRVSITEAPTRASSSSTTELGNLSFDERKVLAAIQLADPKYSATDYIKDFKSKVQQQS